MESVEDVKANCMAVLISGGGGLTEKQLSSDYRSLVGKSIPFTQLGYSSLRDFIESLGFCITRNNFGESVIKQFYDKNTAHISSLIARQRKKPGSGKGKKRGSLRPSPKYKPPSFKYNYDSSYSHRPQPPKPRYSNPPIIPQRQPFTGSTSKPSYCPPVVSPKKSPSSFPLHHKQSSSPSPNSSVQRRLEIKAPVLDIVAVHSQIVSVDTRGTDSFGESNCAKATDAKEQTMVKEPPEDATFVDIQWLQGKVRSSNKKNVTIPRTDSSHLPSLLDKVIIPPTSKVSPMYTAASPTKTKNLPSLFDKEILPPLRPPSPRGCVVPPNNTQVFKSFVSELFKMTENNKWDEPEYKVLQRRPFKGQSMFTAKVKVGNEIHLSSFPDEKPTAEEAQELVAKLACIELSKRLNQSTPGSESVVNSDFVSRIVEIVGDKSNGMFDDAVASLYLEKFGSKLPDDWLNLLSPQNFTVDKTAGKFIIYPTFTSEVTHQIDLKFNGLDINDNSILDPAVNVPGFVSIERKPAKLTLPDDATWDVFVASVSSNDLWIRFIGDDYDVEYNNMMNNLELELLSKSIKASDFVLDNYYVAKFDNCWLRVQLKEVAVDGSDECLVFLIDNGEVDSVPLSELQVLDDKYLQLPPQAVRCKLTYVDLGYGEAQSYVLTNVLGSTFVAEVLVPPTEDQVLSIVLHNTAVEGSPTNVNSMILEQIISKLDPPTLPMRTLATLHLTHIEEQSLPWVQLESRDLALLELILEDLSRLDLVEIHGLNAHPRPGQNEKESMYLVKSKERPHTWCRGVIVTPDPKSPLVHFIDFGYKQKCYWNEIFDLEKVLPVLKKFPPQAIQITLDGLKVSDITTGVVRRIQELIPDDSPILGKIRDEDLQSVEIFKRVQPGNMLASINSDLIHNFEELSTKATEPMAMDLPRQSVLRAFSTLPTYKPPADDFFDVYVSFSSNPYNFVVQPVKELNTTFNTLMKDMQEYYEAQYDIMPVPVLGDFVQNAVFAAKHPDDLQWYRVSVVQAIGDSMVSIKYVDYGDAGLLSIESIRYLVPRFMMLPALALRAKLHGVQPNAHDWTVEDCVYFNNIVVNKPFVSKVHALNSENVNAWQISLDLIDTSSSCDIHISKKLIDNKIAVLQ